MKFLTQKAGPLPVWAWSAIVAVGGVAILLWYRSRTASAASTAAANSPSAASAVGTSNLPFVPVEQITGLPPSTTSSSSGCSTPDTPVNRADWIAYGGSYWYKPGGQDAPFVKNCVQYSHLVDPTAEAAYKSGGGTPYFFVQPGVPVPGEVGAIYAASAVSGGVGGGAKRGAKVSAIRKRTRAGHGGGGIAGANAALAGQRGGTVPAGPHYAPVDPSIASSRLGVPIARLQATNPQMKNDDGNFAYRNGDWLKIA